MVWHFVRHPVFDILIMLENLVRKIILIKL